MMVHDKTRAVLARKLQALIEWVVVSLPIEPKRESPHQQFGSYGYVQGVICWAGFH